MIIEFDLGSASNHDNMNAVPAVDTVISAGSVIDNTGAVVSGVAFSCAANPFSAVSATSNPTESVFPGINATARRSFASVSYSNPDDLAECVITGLPAGLYRVTLFGYRQSQTSAPAFLILNGRTAVAYNAGTQSMVYEDHIAVDEVELDGSTNMVIGVYISAASGFAYANIITIEDITPPAPELTVIDADNILVDGQQNFTATVTNIPTGEVPLTARIGSTAGVGGTLLTGFSAATTATAGTFICTMDLASGIATSSNVASELTISYGTP